MPRDYGTRSKFQVDPALYQLEENIALFIVVEMKSLIRKILLKSCKRIMEDLQRDAAA